MKKLLIYKKAFEYKKPNLVINYYPDTNIIESCGIIKNYKRFGVWRWYYKDGKIALMVNYTGDGKRYNYIENYGLDCECFSKEYYLVDQNIIYIFVKK